jgi:hypothetical protein
VLVISLPVADDEDACDDYVCEVISFYPPRPATFWNPPDGEFEWGKVYRRTYGDRTWKEVDLDVLVEHFIRYNQIEDDPRKSARDKALESIDQLFYDDTLTRYRTGD